MLNFCGLPGASGVEKVVITTDVLGLPANPDLRNIFPVLSGYVNSVNAGLVPAVTALVLAIFSLRNIAQVGNSVVTGDAVDMVDTMHGEAPVMVKPRKAMGLPYTAKDTNPDIPAPFMDCAHYLAFLPPRELSAELIATGIFAAREYPCFRVIMDICFKLFLGNHFGTLSKVVRRMRQALTRRFSGAPYPQTESINNFSTKQWLAGGVPCVGLRSYL